MARSAQILTLVAAALSAGSLAVRAGDNVVTPGTRREFHMSATYPFVFRPDNYLVNQGPEAMRYGSPAIDPGHRRAPGLDGNAKGPDPIAHQKDLLKKSEEKAAQAAASPSPAAQPTPDPAQAVDKQTVSSVPVQTTASAPVPAIPPAPAEYPVPDNAPQQPSKGAADFSQAPDEVSGYFRNPYNFVPNSHRFFDPIFQPAIPATSTSGQAEMGPKSTATYVEKP